MRYFVLRCCEWDVSFPYQGDVLVADAKGYWRGPLRPSTGPLNLPSVKKLGATPACGFSNLGIQLSTDQQHDPAQIEPQYQYDGSAE